MTSAFKIYNASAGSGKTHSLTKAYLKIVLSRRGSFKRILAITFTNKAVAEMKHRILDSLFRFATVDDAKDTLPLFRDLMDELQLDAATLRERSRATLKEILHNYAFFDISTIDGFTHRLIRTFAKDLKIPQNFEVVLDRDLLLEEAVARLLQKAGSDPQLTRVLLDFAMEKIDDDRHWDVSRDFIDIGKLLFDETHAEHLENLREKDIDAFLGLKKTLYQRSRSLEAEMIATAQSTLDSIAEKGLAFTDFTSSYFPKFLAKIAEGNQNINFNAGWKQHFETTKLYNKTAPESVKSTLDGMHPEFVAAFGLIKSGHHRLAFLKNAYNNIVPLTVLNAIHRELKSLQTENEELSISEFNVLISKEIKNQPAPFIYERLGEKYRHYFIDEFQDTSAMQWNNLVPLIGNALESEDMQGEKGSLFLVGDAKQAIYRWRGGRAEQFLDLVNKASNPFMTAPETDDLPTNWRSHEEIVKFNNAFFTATSPFLNNELYRTMFAKGNQQGHTAKKGGTVQLQFIEDDADADKNELYCEAVLQTIGSVTEKGYGYGSICILVRGNKEGILLADYLTQRRLPTISSESLLLKNNDEVRFLIDLSGFAADLGNLEAAYGILSFLSDRKSSSASTSSSSESPLSSRPSPEKSDRHSFIFDNLKKVPQLLKTAYGFDISSFERLSVYDGMERAIEGFDLAPASNAYITYFMDVVLQVERKEGTGLQAFLAYWDKKGDKLSISAPENIDAVRIMTVHKAKGLEFPVVIFPFANQDMYRRQDKKMWLPVDAVDFNGFGEVLVNEKKEVENYGEMAAALYHKEEHKMELDALNVLYVALTRAEKALCIISEKDLTKNGEHKMTRYSGLFIDFLKKDGRWSDNETTYTYGALDKNTDPPTDRSHEHIAYQYSHKNRPGFRILTKSGMLWDTEREEALSRGNRIHYILGLIATERDVDPALDHVVRNGTISEEEVAAIRATVRQVMEHPELTEFYTEAYSIKNEKDIISRNGNILRPDRIAIQGKQAALIDYKTGRPDPKYKEQLYDYADALEDMGYSVDDRILIFINDTIRVERV